MRHPPPRHLGHVQQSVHSAQINECAVLGETADLALTHQALVQPGECFGTLTVPLFFHDQSVRQHYFLVRAVGLKYLQAQHLAHEPVQVPHVPGGHVRRGHEARHANVHSQAALHALGHHRVQDLAILGRIDDPVPHPLVVGALLGEDQTLLIVPGLDDRDLDLVVPFRDLRLVSELVDLNYALGLAANVHQYDVVPDLGHNAGHDVALGQRGGACLQIDVGHGHLTLRPDRLCGGLFQGGGLRRFVVGYGFLVLRFLEIRAGHR